MYIYNTSARAVKAVHASLRVGGPASAGLGLLPEFIAGCEEFGAPYDFVSSHSYPTDTWGNARGGVCPSSSFYWDPHCFTDNVAAASKKVRDLTGGTKDFYLTEYNEVRPEVIFVFFIAFLSSPDSMTAACRAAASLELSTISPVRQLLSSGCCLSLPRRV